MALPAPAAAVTKRRKLACEIWMLTERHGPGPQVAQAWTIQARRALMMRGADVELAGQIEKQLKAALTTSGHTDRTASMIAEAVASGIRPRGTDISQNVAA